MKLSLIIPVFNERPLLRTFWNTLATAPLGKCPELTEVEIIVVDDGSDDGSAELLRELCATPMHFASGLKSQVKFLSHPRNEGKGRCVQSGIAACTGDVVVIQDSDLEYSPTDLPSLIAPILRGDADAVYGGRFTGSYRRVMFFWHAVFNGLLTTLCNLLTDLNLSDVETGYKAIRGDLARAIRLASSRFGIDVEITARLAGARARIFEVPITYNGRDYADGKKLTRLDGIAAFFHIVKYALWDSEPFRSGLHQTIGSVDEVSDGIYVPVLRRALKGLENSKGKLRILEIGAGTGALTRFLLKYGSVVATDLATDFLEVAKNRFQNYEGFQCRQWDATKPFISNGENFDLIVAVNLLEHLEHDVDALKNWRELLTPTGQILLLVPNYPGLYSPIDKAIFHFRRYSRWTLMKTLRDAGFPQVKISYGNPLGIIGWFLNGVVLKRSDLPRRQFKFYKLLKPFLSVFERPLEKRIGINLIALAQQPVPADELQKAA